MPKAYEAMRDKFSGQMGLAEAKTKAARIYNSLHPDTPVTRSHKDSGKKKKKGMFGKKG